MPHVQFFDRSDFMEKLYPVKRLSGVSGLIPIHLKKFLLLYAIKKLFRAEKIENFSPSKPEKLVQNLPIHLINRLVFSTAVEKKFLSNSHTTLSHRINFAFNSNQHWQAMKQKKFKEEKKILDICLFVNFFKL